MSKILIVEDDDALRETLEIGLRSNGFDVCQAATGLEAIPVFEQQKPDLILLDLMLPGKNGIEICHEIRQTSGCLLYTSPSPRDRTRSRMPSSA